MNILKCITATFLIFFIRHDTVHPSANHPFVSEGMVQMVNQMKKVSENIETFITQKNREKIALKAAIDEAICYMANPLISLDDKTRCENQTLKFAELLIATKKDLKNLQDIYEEIQKSIKKAKRLKKPKK